MRWLTFAILGKRIRSMKKFLLDPDVPKRKKLLVIFGIIYLFMPIDIVPEPVLGIGLIDDVVLWLFILTHLSDELDSYWKDSGEAAQYKKKKDTAHSAGSHSGQTIEAEGRVVEDSSDGES